LSRTDRRTVVTLKLATSLDGRIATASGESRWITGQEAREQGHRLRAEHDAVVVGIGTVLADNPQLTVRLEDYLGVQPARIVFDTHQRLGTDANLVQTAHQVATILVTADPLQQRLTDAGVLGVQVGLDALGHVDIAQALAALTELGYRLGRGLDRLYIEGGGQLAASFIAAGLVDRLEWFRAPLVLGGQGRPGIGDLAVEALALAPRFKIYSVAEVGVDLWERYARI
jgi:diaminohydroxyphosphoribosylaminopyrimidine deaminase/5-amino-6-(5-phosphoribosylamino)uracil reductase